jgi:hypothetical protein
MTTMAIMRLSFIFFHHMERRSAVLCFLNVIDCLFRESVLSTNNEIFSPRSRTFSASHSKAIKQTNKQSWYEPIYIYIYIIPFPSCCWAFYNKSFLNANVSVSGVQHKWAKRTNVVLHDALDFANFTANLAQLISLGIARVMILQSINQSTNEMKI